MHTRIGSALIAWMILLGVILIAGVLGFKFWKNRGAPKYEFQTDPVTRGALTQAVTATGTLNPVINVQVGSQISGKIKELFADWNSEVKAGQIVAQIDPATYQAIVAQAEGDLANARAALELAQIQLKRSQDLRAKDSTPQANLDQALASVHQAEATVKTKEGSLDLAKANLNYCTIISPVDGIVISRNVDVGQTVAAGLNAPVLFVIANDLAKMQIDTNVAEADVSSIQVGQDVDFLVDAFPYTTFHGKVRQVRNSPITVQNVVTYDAVIDVSNAELKLKPGMTATVSVIIARRDDALQVSNAALRVRLPESAGGEPAPDSTRDAPASSTASGRKKQTDPARRFTRTVYVLREGATLPKAAKITIGISDGIKTEIVEGLKEGDKVVTAVLNLQNAGQQSTNPFGPQRKF